MDQASSKDAPAPTLFALSEKSVAALNQAIVKITDSTAYDLRVTLEDERGRLKVWASNLGALQHGTSQKSLDYRLRDAPLMRTTVALGLEDLHVSAERALAILNGSIPNRSAPHPSGDNTQTINELDELMAGIHSAISHLFGISMLIRRQQPRGRVLDLDDFTVDSSPDITYVADRFPKAKSNLWLARRLGNNISKQRKIIQYRQEHRASLGKVTAEQPGVCDAATVIATTYEEVGHSEASHPQQVPKGVIRSNVSAFTSATSFQSLGDEQGIGRPIPNLSDMILDGVKLQYGEPFECPYCRTIQVAASRYQWKRHVFTDLQPYICTIRNCGSGNPSFSTRGEWFEHESNVHRWHWECSWCSSSTSRFPSAEEFKQHLNKSHPGKATEAQIPLIVQACERPMKTFNLGSCPLCEDWTPTSVNNNARGFSRHLARHLQQLSLSSIPISIPGLEIRISGDGSDVEHGSSGGSSDESVQQERDSPAPLWKFKKEVAQLVAAEEAAKKAAQERDNPALLWKIEEENKKAAHAAAAEEAAKRTAQRLKANIEEEMKTKLAESKRKAELAPIRFKDAVGRKFSFPFHLCDTWQGMEDLIKQAFMQVDVLGPHVMEGHYDLIGPDGELILPSVWENVIQPDWAITMTMWPMEKMPPLGHHRVHGFKG